ncbi:hypothetical protein E4U30_008103 [Claviceps sp. LM220 group G6]|nr:hypothetical protein E4U30_008103 [Claviceps sp. LM220 group G6]KAG6104756.1 hypothetical protein E4U14_005498 [Claviceps sp. LM454 group G7]
MPPMSTHAPGRTTENASGQDSSPSDSLPVHPAPSIDVQRSDGQGFQDRPARAEAAIGMARADAAEAEARASAAMHNPQPTLNLDPVYNSETWGRRRRCPGFVNTIARNLVVPAEAVYQIWVDKFEPLNLLRLDPTQGWFVYENESTAGFYSPRGILLKKKIFTAKDYGDNPALFMTAFSTYIVVYHSLFSQWRMDVHLAQRKFLLHLLDLSRNLNWESCLEYAMSRLTTIMANDVHDVAEWHI